MKANELRIGSLIYDDNILPCKVVGLLRGEKEDSFCVLVDTYVLDRFLPTGRLISVSDISPILLTEEILLKCGFVNNEPKDWGSFTLGNINFLKEDGNKMNGLYMNGYRVADIRYLHQLQNLYFAITGEELEIEL